MSNQQNLRVNPADRKPTGRTKETSRTSDIFIAVVFLLILLTVPLSYFLSGPNEVSEVEQRWLEQLTRPSKTSLLDKSYQDQLTKALTDQFPGRDIWLLFRSMIIRKISLLAYAPLPDTAIPITDNGNVLLWHSEQGLALVYAPEIYDHEILPEIDRRVEEYNRVTKEFPDVNFYVFDIRLPVTSKHHPVQHKFGNTVGTKYRDYFLLNVSGINYGELSIRHADDILNNFYKTDHHWNIFGAWASYEQLYGMIKLNYPEISAQKSDALLKQAYGIDSFRGSFARLAAYRTVSDDFYGIATKELEPHITLVNGIESARGLREISVDYREISDSPFANHYGYYYGFDYALVEYIFDNTSDRNLLLIGSSYTQAIEYLLASHYAHTYVIDLRHYRQYAGKKFSIVDFININRIHDVVVLGDYHVCYTQLQWKLLPDTK